MWNEEGVLFPLCVGTKEISDKLLERLACKGKQLSISVKVGSFSSIFLLLIEIIIF